MSTVKATNFSHPSAANPAIVLDAAGGATVAGMGLVLVSPTSIANSGGSASASGGQVTFTGVSSVSLNGVFTSAYQNYKILFNAIGSTTSVLKMRMRASGSDNTSSNYIYQHLIANGATITSDRVTATQFYPTVIGTANPIGFEIIMTNPYITDKTLFQSVSFDGWQPQLIVAGGTTTVTTQYDGFTFFMDSGNMTGTVRVYGYKNS